MPLPEKTVLKLPGESTLYNDMPLPEKTVLQLRGEVLKVVPGEGRGKYDLRTLNKIFIILLLLH